MESNRSHSGYIGSNNKLKRDMPNPECTIENNEFMITQCEDIDDFEPVRKR